MTASFLLFAVAGHAHAEWFGDLYGGVAYTPRSDIPPLTGTITGARVPTKFDLDTHHVVAGVSFRF